MSHTRLFSKYFPLLLVLALLIAATSCSNHDGPLAPTTELSMLDIGDPIASPNFVVINKARKGDTGIQMTTTVVQTVSAALGGVVNNGRVSLYFPPGTLAVDTEIQIDMDSSGLMISNMAPDGIQFAEGVILSMNLSGTSAESLADNTFVAWFDEEDDRWEMILNLPPPDANTISARLDHFSKYSGVGG